MWSGNFVVHVVPKFPVVQCDRFVRCLLLCSMSILLHTTSCWFIHNFSHLCRYPCLLGVNVYIYKLEWSRRVQQSSITINWRMHKQNNRKNFLVHKSIICFDLYMWIYILSIFVCVLRAWRLRVRWTGRDIDTRLYTERCNVCEWRRLGREECLEMVGPIRPETLWGNYFGTNWYWSGIGNNAGMIGIVTTVVAKNLGPSDRHIVTIRLPRTRWCHMSVTLVMASASKITWSDSDTATESDDGLTSHTACHWRNWH